MSGSEAPRVVVRRRIRATREELFDAWTDAEGMREWMCPGDVESAEVRMEPRVGGKIEIIMRTAREAFEHRGEFRVVERPGRLVFTWSARATAWRETLVTVELVEVSAVETELVLTHEGIEREDVREQYGGGWSGIVGKLEEYLKGPAA